MGRERGYPLGARGSPCDADYEDGSVPLQLPLSCADHCIEARREGCHLREIGRVSSSGRHQPASVRISSRPTELSVGPRLRRQALRLRRTAHAAAGLPIRRFGPRAPSTGKLLAVEPHGYLADLKGAGAKITALGGRLVTHFSL